MARAQSSPLSAPTPVPPFGTRPRWRDAGWLARYAAIALVELARARIVFARLQANDIPARNSRAMARPQAGAHVAADNAVLTARIAYVIPRLARRLPWRSDCLVQALAAQTWLARHGLASEIRIGVERATDKPFGAHAWLVHEDRVITGGEIGQYALLLGGEQQAQARN